MKAQSCPSTGSAADFLPRRISLPQLRKAAAECRGCTLYCNATQVVFGEGPAPAPLMLVGEQPGDQEDLAGRPFVGPAGRLLDDSLAQAGIERESVFVTNAVKHFKFEPRGKRRIHSKPNAREVKACRPWLEAEIQLVKPHVLVALGATAAQSLLGSAFRLTRHRGEFITATQWAPLVLATLHPSALLRIPDESARRQARAEFVADLKQAAARLGRAQTAA
jgi:DNA polymerase